MTLITVPRGYEMKHCVWKNRSDCMKDKPLGTGDSIKELIELFPENKYPERIFGMTFVKKSLLEPLFPSENKASGKR